MSLPPGFLDELRSRTSLAQVVGRKVMWDARKSNQGKGDMWAPCPFHHEKTASFHVDDRKGYYYCFGCHAKGDAISFVRETENVDFMEAIRILAGEAGLAMPERDPQAQQKADKRTELIAVMEQAVQFFRLQLQTGAGASARDYLEGRGLRADTQERFEVGFAPDGWQNLWDHLKGKGVEDQLILECGLGKPSTKQGGRPYDTFRNRIMFPIRDARGRCIAFGGRAMDPNDNAKYLNSPETLLFDKSRTLYNHGPAREAAGKGHDLIVAEGYMDVIALVEEGFEAAVAPLGTAVTEAQLQLLWRMHPEPVIALDGDAAGQRAAGRVIDLALPMLSESNSLFFLKLPQGKDPDDFLKAEGSQGFARILQEKKLPLVRALWERELETAPTDTPEQKAGLDKRLRAAILKIEDRDIKKYYGEAIKQFRWDHFKPTNWAPEYRRKPSGKGSASVEARASLLAQTGDGSVSNLLDVKMDELHAMRERLVAAISLANPETAFAFRDGLERFEVGDMNARHFLEEIVHWSGPMAPEEGLDLLRLKLGEAAVNAVMNDRFVRIHPAVRKRQEADLVLLELAENIARVAADRAAKMETKEAADEIDDLSTEALTWRLGQSSLAYNEAMQGQGDDRAQYEFDVNGAPINREELGAFELILRQIGHGKPQ